MDAVMGADPHLCQVLRQVYPAQRAGEGLFIHMRMDQFPRSQNGIVRAKDLPRIGIMVPAFVGMFDRDIEPPRPSWLMASIPTTRGEFASATPGISTNSKSNRRIRNISFSSRRRKRNQDRPIDAASATIAGRSANAESDGVHDPLRPRPLRPRPLQPGTNVP